jgi:hypothetical protein
MSDLFDELRDADPVDREQLEVPPALAARIAASGPPRSHRRVRPLLVGAVGLTAAIVIAGALSRGDGGGRLSLADKAYAATTGQGVRHWKISVRTFIDGRRRGIVQRQEGWAQGATLHVLLFDGRHLTTDMHSTPGGTRSWSAGMNDYIQVAAPKHGVTGPLSLGDPFADFRRAYDTGRLVRINATTYRMRPNRQSIPPEATVTYELDAKTARPTESVFAYTRARGPSPTPDDGRHVRTVFTYDTYERLPDTAANRSKLNLLPHPGAGPSKTDARAVFSILRDGAPVTGKQRDLIAVFAKHAMFGAPRFDVASARRGPHGVVLIAGHGYVGVLRNGGGTLATVDTAIKRGMAIGGSAVNRNHSMYVVAPDGVKAIRARLPHHSWKTFAVTQNVAVLPNGGYHFRFLR